MIAAILEYRLDALLRTKKCSLAAGATMEPTRVIVFFLYFINDRALSVS